MKIVLTKGYNMKSLLPKYFKSAKPNSLNLQSAYSQKDVSKESLGKRLLSKERVAQEAVI